MPADDLTELFRDQHAKAVRLAYLLTGDNAAAEDIVAEAFMKIARASGRTIEHPAAYLRRAVVNEANSRWRRLARERAALERHTADDRGQLDLSEQTADHDLVWQALAQLPPRQRTAVVLRFYEDATELEAAAVMGVSRGTIKSTTARGLDRLKALLSDQAAVATAA